MDRSVTRECLDAITYEPHTATFEVGGYYPFHFGTKHVQRADYVFSVLVDVVRDVRRKAVDVRVKANQLLTLRVSRRQRHDVHVAERWRLARELEAADGIVLQFLTPLSDNFISRYVQLRCALTCLHLSLGKGGLFG